MLAPGQDLGPYHIHQHLGGRHASHWLATHQDSGRQVVIQVPADRAMAERVLLAARILAMLRDHPNLVGILDVVDADGEPGCVLEYVEGPSLRQRLDEGPIPPDERDRIVDGLLSAVDTLHQRGVVHRNLKPAKVLISEADGLPRLGGLVFATLARDRDAPLPAPPFVVGTPHYMAPEQTRDSRTVHASADVWSLGVVLYELVTGELPFTGDSVEAIFAAVQSGVHTPVAELAPALEPERAAAIEAALVVDADDRLDSVQALRAAWFGKEDPSPPARQWWRFWGG